MNTWTLYVGIDVSKAQVDIAVRHTGQLWSVSNDEAGITQLLPRLQELHPELIVLEATGGQEVPVHAHKPVEYQTRYLYILKLDG